MISSPTLLACQALNDSRFSIRTLQFHAILAQDRRDFSLRTLQLTDRTVHQEFGTFANIRQRSFQFMRHMPQEPILFLGEIQQSASQPFQLRGEALEVGGGR